jgi:hypothetical protein
MDSILIFEDGEIEKIEIFYLTKKVLKDEGFHMDIIQSNNISEYEDILKTRLNGNIASIKIIITDILNYKDDLCEYDKWDKESKSDNISQEDKQEYENKANEELITAGMKKILEISKTWEGIEHHPPIFIITQIGQHNFIKILEGKKKEASMKKLFADNIDNFIKRVHDRAERVEECVDLTVFFKKESSKKENKTLRDSVLDKRFETQLVSKLKKEIGSNTDGD